MTIIHIVLTKLKKDELPENWKADISATGQAMVGESLSVAFCTYQYSPPVIAPSPEGMGSVRSCCLIYIFPAFAFVSLTSLYSIRRQD